MPLPNKIAFAGFADTGKDPLAVPFIEMGYERRCVGDIIKSAINHREINFLVVSNFIRRTYPNRYSELIVPVYAAFNYLLLENIDAFTEDPVEKAGVRAAMEWGGLAYWDSIIDQFISSLPEKCINTRLMQVDEARRWKAIGGIIVDIKRHGYGPVSMFEQDHYEQLSASGLIDHTFINEEGLDQSRIKLVEMLKNIYE